MNLEDYSKYLSNEKKVSNNTLIAYLRDIEHFEKVMQKRGISDLTQVNNSDIVSFVMELNSENSSRPTINRKLASIRTFYKYLIKKRLINEDPTIDIKTPRVEKKDIEYLSIEEIDNLMKLPDNSARGIRDRAILELLYATGMRATELIDLKVSDINIRMGIVKLSNTTSKSRVIPMGRICRNVLEEYIYDIRDKLITNSENDYLFVNYIGEKLTRQGLWKILKEYGEEAKFEIVLSPQVIRNSFAIHMLQNGADIKSLQELMGNIDIKATQAYLQITKNRIKDVYDKAHPRA